MKGFRWKGNYVLWVVFSIFVFCFWWRWWMRCFHVVELVGFVAKVCFNGVLWNCKAFPSIFRLLIPLTNPRWWGGGGDHIYFLFYWYIFLIKYVNDVDKQLVFYRFIYFILCYCSLDLVEGGVNLYMLSLQMISFFSLKAKGTHFFIWSIDYFNGLE